MNSALQCMRSVEELSKYFLSGEYKKEINEDNPLGYGGAVAQSYGKLIREVYDEGSRTSFAPRNFRNTVGSFRSQFASWSQQDSQEFLGFMLDALQEDLSRVKKKPYIEKPDSTDDMIDNPAAVKAMAEKVWDITRLRDDSVIADLFTGMYKSTLKCPECAKISITFDPFNNLTLPLPVENMQHATVRFFPLNDAPVDLDVEVPKHSTIDLLKQFIASRTGVPAERMIGAEEYQERFFKVYADADDVTEDIRPNDQATFHELEVKPTNWPLPTNARRRNDNKQRQQQAVRSMLDVDAPPPRGEDDDYDERCERLVVPVLHRIRGRHSKDTNRANAVVPPHFVVVTREEAMDEDAIRRKVLEKVATFSTWSLLHEDDDEEEEEEEEEGEKDGNDAAGREKMVDTEKGEIVGDDSAAEPSSYLLKRFNKRRPLFADRTRFLDPSLQNLFTLHYFSDNNSSAAIPTGWTSLNSQPDRPLLSSRLPASPTMEPALSPDRGSSSASASASPTASVSVSSSPSGDSRSSLGDESDGEDGAPPRGGVLVSTATRMANESSDDDATPPPIVSGGGGRAPWGGSGAGLLLTL
jgi:ubiquitin carboxyl-terminal hydrolase 4/11/15